MKKLLTLLCILLLALCTAGCAASGGTEYAVRPAVIFLVANTANSEPLNFNSPRLRELAEDLVRNEGFAAVISVDGNPEAVFAGSFERSERLKNASREKQKIEAEANTVALLSLLESTTPNDEEVDFLKALRLSERLFKSLDDSYTSKTILVLGTGLNTSGQMNYCNQLLLAEPEALVSELAARSAIPDLSGISLFWQFSDTAEPQAPLSDSQRERLEQQWEAVVNRGGGSFDSASFLSGTSRDESTLPHVSVVELAAETPIHFEPQILAEAQISDEPQVLEEEHDTVDEPDIPFSQPVLFCEDDIHFLPDSARFLHPEEVNAILSSVASYLIENKSVTLLVCGSIAGDSGSGSGLPKERAQAVKEALIELGVPSDQLVAKGLGPKDDPFHIKGVGYEGELAASNRHVFMLNIETPLAQKLLGN